MSKLKNDKAQYEKYLSGKMSQEEANAFEREVLSDPFEQEALEGFESNDAAAFADIEKLQSKVLRKDRGGFGWMRIAAVVALLVVGYFTVWLVIKPIAVDNDLAQEIQKGKEPEAQENSEEDLSPSIGPDEQSSSKTQEKNKVEPGPKITEARAIKSTESQTEERFFETETEEVAATDNFADDSDLPAILEIETDADDLGEMALAMESKADAAFQIGAPVAVPKANDILPDTLDSISLSQNLVAQGDEVVNDVVIEELSIARKVQAANARSRRQKVADIPDEIAELDEVVVTSFGGAGQSPPFLTSDLRSITGTITDETGERMPGVNVVIKGTTTGATSDLNGNYELFVNSDATLVISFVGFETQEIEVEDRTEIDITIGGVTELQEVVVTGYGTTSQKASSFTPARPITGNRAYKKYLEENLQYPEQAISNEIEGTVTLELTISPSGVISNIDIKKSLGYGCDVEAIRLVNEGPKWSGAEKNGSQVEDKAKVKVKFKR